MLILKKIIPRSEKIKNPDDSGYQRVWEHLVQTLRRAAWQDSSKSEMYMPLGPAIALAIASCRWPVFQYSNHPGGSSYKTQHAHLRAEWTRGRFTENRLRCG